MVYSITITQTTGKIIEQAQFSDLTAAQAFYRQTLETTSYKRVLVLLLEKPTPFEENILEVEYIEGVTYIHPATTYAAVAATALPDNENPFSPGVAIPAEEQSAFPVQPSSAASH